MLVCTKECNTIMKILTIAICFVVLVLSVDANSNETWRNVGDCGEGLTCNATCQLRCLEMHNYYRSLHNSPPLFCDHQLATSAQQWSNQQAKDGRMYHSPWTNKFSESIAGRGEGWLGMNQVETAVAGAVRGWYSEIKNDYNYATGQGNGLAVGHFQAVVWKATTKLGCGVKIKSGGGTYITARTTPAMHADANFYENAPENVKPRNDSATACDVKSSDRELCDGDLKAPYVTPDQCLRNGCCYDDVFLSEPSVWFYSSEGRKWCFKPKNGG